jgi:hypothetical protein
MMSESREKTEHQSNVQFGLPIVWNQHKQFLFAFKLDIDSKYNDTPCSRDHGVDLKRRCIDSKLLQDIYSQLGLLLALNLYDFLTAIGATCRAHGVRYLQGVAF